MEIIWSDFAIASLKEVYDYFVANASRDVADGIKQKIFNATRQLETHPMSGQIEIFLSGLNQSHRYLVCGHYKIIYRVAENTIIINDVFDTRQNPQKLVKNMSSHP